MAEALPRATRRAKTNDGTRALASPVLELASLGAMQVILGLAFGGVAIGVAGPVQAVFGILFGGVFFGALMYRLVYRRYARGVVEELRAPPTAARESNARTVAREALLTALLGVLFALIIWAFHDPSVVAGITIGNGIGCLLTSRWFRSWEEEHQSRLLREPRYRWSRSRRHGWGRGRGIFEPQDFYAVGSTTPAV